MEGSTYFIEDHSGSKYSKLAAADDDGDVISRRIPLETPNSPGSSHNGNLAEIYSGDYIHGKEACVAVGL
jgi:hypothetical protein